MSSSPVSSSPATSIVTPSSSPSISGTSSSTNSNSPTLTLNLPSPDVVDPTNTSGSPPPNSSQATEDPIETLVATSTPGNTSSEHVASSVGRDGPSEETSPPTFETTTTNSFTDPPFSADNTPTADTLSPTTTSTGSGMPSTGLEVTVGAPTVTVTESLIITDPASPYKVPGSPTSLLIPLHSASSVSSPGLAPSSITASVAGPSSASASSTDTPPEASSISSAGGADEKGAAGRFVAGIVVGIVAVLLALLLLCWKRKSKRSKVDRVQHAPASVYSPSAMSASTPFSAPATSPGTVADDPFAANRPSSQGRYPLKRTSKGNVFTARPDGMSPAYDHQVAGIVALLHTSERSPKAADGDPFRDVPRGESFTTSPRASSRVESVIALCSDEDRNPYHKLSNVVDFLPATQWQLASAVPLVDTDVDRNPYHAMGMYMYTGKTAKQDANTRTTLLE